MMNNSDYLRNKRNRGFFSYPLLIMMFYAIIGVGGSIGYIMNVVKFVRSDFEAPYKNEVVRGICLVVIPVGCIVGYIDLGK